MENGKIEKGEEDRKSIKPVDVPEKQTFVYIAFLLAGVGYNLPDYCISSAVDYYQIRFPNTTFIYDITASRHFCCIIGYILNNALIESVGFTWRISIGYLINTSLLIFLTVGDVILRWFSNDVAYTMTVMVASISGIVLAVQQSSYYGYANMLPPRYMQAVSTGESLSGVLISGGRILTKLKIHDERTNTIIFYMCCISLILICTAAFFIARRTKFVNYHVGLCKSDVEKPPNYSVDSQQEELRKSADGILSLTYGTVENGGLPSGDRQTAKDTVGSRLISDVYCVRDNSYDATKASDNISSVPLLTPNGKTCSKLKAMLKYRWEVTLQVWQYILVIGVVNLFTVMLFPSIVTEIVSCSLGSWMPVILMAAFNVPDCFARSITFYRIVRESTFMCLKSGSFLRVIFLPLFLLCCLPRSHPVIDKEPLIIFLVVVFGLTNGLFLTTTYHMAGIVKPNDREMCGNLMMMAAIVSMTVAVILSYIIDYFAGLHSSHNSCYLTWSNVTSASNVTHLPWTV